MHRKSLRSWKTPDHCGDPRWNENHREKMHTSTLHFWPVAQLSRFDWSRAAMLSSTTAYMSISIPRSFYEHANLISVLLKVEAVLLDASCQACMHLAPKNGWARSISCFLLSYLLCLLHPRQIYLCLKPNICSTPLNCGASVGQEVFFLDILNTRERNSGQRW